ncbi:MAG: hypothetical protein ACK47B_11340 [Armatimonadota bacterium]
MAKVPRPIITVHGEDVNLEVPGILTLRANFLSEGLFDEAAQGDPDEEDLYEIELTDESDDAPIPISFTRLAQSAPDAWLAEVDEDEPEAPRSLPIEGFLLALAWQLAHTDPSEWYPLCESARRWDGWTIDDQLERLPADWTPASLPPTDD